MRKLNPNDITVKTNKAYLYMDQSYQINYLTFQTSKLLKLNEYTKTWFGLKSGNKVPSDLNVERCY